MKPESAFYCSVPVPERKDAGVTIHGNLYSEKDLKSGFEKHGFTFNTSSVENGALLYFNAALKKTQ